MGNVRSRWAMLAASVLATATLASCGTAAQARSANPSDQNFGRTEAGGAVDGRNGIVVWKANGVSIDNLTVCNFLAGSHPSGNEIWWNGGAESGTIGLHQYSGSYLTATTTFLG